MPAAGLRIGIIEPHLLRYGGIRRMVEFANRLVARGHTVTFYLPDDQVMACGWMPCDAAIVPVTSGFDDELDVVLFTHEPQWHLLERFTRARRRVFYALHYSKLYGKEGSWEAIRAPVDLQLANSNWTADQMAAETGHRPLVQLGGVNRDIFRPYGGPKRYDVLCTGDHWRDWKGTATITHAARILRVPVEGYSEKDLSQPDLGREYDAARVFVVGSWFEGFCQPGLEALACGTPLVTTDNGGCREYAIDGETALVVPPRDARAMADAIARLLDDEVLAKELSANGLDLVARDFDWEQRADELEAVLDGVVAGPGCAPPPPWPSPPAEPELSVVTLAWDNLGHTMHFGESVRRNTDVPYELVIVDNGSRWEAANYAAVAADRSVLNERNLGFSRGMNQGLDVATGEWVAFCNNDTILPPRWASRLLETAKRHPNAGIVVPALTAARNEVTVRRTPGTEVHVLQPFSPPPSAVLYLMRADLVRTLGGWGEDYEIASGEDVDLAFTVWVNDLDIVFDERVLVRHVGKGTASRLTNWRRLWARNRQHFLTKWSGRPAVVRLETCEPERFERNLATAAAVAGWMQRYFDLRDQPVRERAAGLGRSVRSRGVELASRGVWRVKAGVSPATMRTLRRVLARLNPEVEARLRKAVRSLQ